MRVPDWEQRLRILVDQWTARQYEPGTTDCARFAAAWTEAVTGTLYWPVGDYATVRDGLEQLRQQGFEDHIAYAESLFKRMHPSEAMTGDLAVLHSPEGRLLGGVWGARIYVVSVRCLSTMDLSECHHVLGIR